MIVEKSEQAVRQYEQDKMLLAIEATAKNIKNFEGGPFGACLCVDGKDYIEANHVVPLSDASAHAEVDAMRLFMQENGYSHVDNAELYSSGECCPMCLCAAVLFGVKKIVFGHNRKDTEKGAFSDKAQYELLTDALDRIVFDDSVLPLLDREGADFAIVDDDFNVIMSAKKGDDEDFGLASVHLIRKFGSETGEVWAEGNCKLIGRYIPNPAGLIAADWAHLLRKRNKAGEVERFISRGQLTCAGRDFEKAVLHDKDGNEVVIDNAALLYEKICSGGGFGVSIKQIESKEIQQLAKDTFFNFRHTEETTY